MSQQHRNPRTRAAAAVAPARGATAADDTPDYPGKGFGLPASGPMSVAPMGRRLIALVVDWVLCEIIASSIVGHAIFTGSSSHYESSQYLTLGLFVLEVYLLTAVSGLTVGKRLLSIRAIRTDGGSPGFKWAAVRTLFLLFVVPACLMDRDLRGLHDRAADTIVVRLLSPGERPPYPRCARTTARHCARTPAARPVFRSSGARPPR